MELFRKFCFSVLVGKLRPSRTQRKAGAPHFKTSNPNQERGYATAIVVVVVGEGHAI